MFNRTLRGAAPRRSEPGSGPFHPESLPSPDPLPLLDAGAPPRWPSHGATGPASVAEPVRERIVEPAEVRGLLLALVQERAPAWLRVEDGSCLPLSALALDGERLLCSGPSPRARQPSLEWSGFNSLLRAPGVAVAEQRGRLALDPPALVERVQQRAFRRVPLAGAGAVVRCRRLEEGAAFDQAGGELLALRDLSCEGLSVWLPPGPATVSTGDLYSLVVTAPGQPPMVLLGEARALGAGRDGGAAFLGLRVRPRTASDGAAWLLWLEQQVHPRIRVGGECLPEVWTLYEGAGYFALSGKKPADFFDIRASFLDATRRALQIPDVALQAVWPEAGTPVATLSAVRMYESAWLGFHMAKPSGPAPDGTPGRRVLRDIHLSIYERIQRDPGARWIIGHTQVRPVWSRLCHHDLTARFVGAGDAAIWRFRAVEVRRAPPLPPPPGVTVGAATVEERSRVLQILGRRHPEPFVEALDLVPRRFDISGVRRRWWSAGLQRDRGMLVARRGGAVGAALILELSDEGLHVFRLLDHALPVALEPDGARLFPALMAAADQWYRSRGREAWACFFDHTTPVAPAPGLIDLGEADMCVLSTDRLPEFLEHLVAITAPRGVEAPAGPSIAEPRP